MVLLDEQQFVGSVAIVAQIMELDHRILLRCIAMGLQLQAALARYVGKPGDLNYRQTMKGRLDTKMMLQWQDLLTCIRQERSYVQQSVLVRHLLQLASTKVLSREQECLFVSQFLSAGCNSCSLHSGIILVEWFSNSSA